MRAAVTTVILLALAVGGCGGEAGEPEAAGVAGVQTVKDSAESADAFATKAELRWLARLARWTAAFSDAGARVQAFEANEERFTSALAGEAEARERYEELLAPIRDCDRSFARRVGPAPTERLNQAAESYRQSCGHFRRGVELLLEAIDDRDEDLAERARDQIVDAAKEASIASGTLPPGEKQALPVVRDGDGKSRIDPLYGEAASAAAGKEVEVRCWARREWKRLLVEEKVFTRGRVDDEVLGFASAGGARVNLSPTVCEQLDALTYDDARPRAGERRFNQAVALVVLAHEARHAAGVMDEPTAECEGIQLARRAGSRLGLDAAYARDVIGLYWEAYPDLAAEYRSPECRAGGELDLDKGSPEFP